MRKLTMAMVAVLVALSASAQVIVPQILLPTASGPTTYTFAMTYTDKGYNTNGSTTFTVPTTVTTSDGNRDIILGIGYTGDNGLPTGATRNGQTFTSLGTYNGEAWHVAFYELKNPTSGSYNTTVTVSSSTMATSEAIAGVWVFTGVNQTASTGAIGGGFNWGSVTASGTMGSASGDIVCMLAYSNGRPYSSSGSGQTHDWAVNPNTAAAGDHKAATTTSTNLTINWTQSDMWVAGGLAVKPN